MKQAVATMAVWLAAACGPIADAAAAAIFSDDFNRAVSANVGNGWSEIESDDVDVSRSVPAHGFIECDACDVAAALSGIPRFGVVDENPSHHLSGNTEELCLVLPIHAVLPREAEIRFMHECGRLKRVVGPLRSEITGGK